MSYVEYDTPPPYVSMPKWSDPSEIDRTVIRWVNPDPPPPVGAEIIITINNRGPAVVTGYFTEDGWLGLRCRLTNPRDGRDPNGHVFGPEFKLP